jgi:S-DNA-T family DNA segregation ATPase FtsK/SpoIIIE
MLLSLIESDAPQLAETISQNFYPGLWSHHLRYHLGGAPFFYFFHDMPSLNLHHLLNTVGVALIFSTTLITSLIFLFKIRLAVIYKSLIQSLKEGIEKHRLQRQSEALMTPAPTAAKEAKKNEEPFLNKGQPETESDFLRFVKLRIPTNVQDISAKSTSLAHPQEMLEIHPEKNLKIRPSISRKEQTDCEAERDENNEHGPLSQHKKKEEARVMSLPTEDDREAFKKRVDSPSRELTEKARKREGAIIAQSIHNGDFSKYILPSPSLLTNPKMVDQTSIKKDLKRQAEVLEETLLSFGIEAKVGQINCGPTITSFEVHPAIGVKVQKIKSLDNDIALNMEAKSIRIIAPIPGKAAVGIEVPNPQPQEVAFKDTLLAYQQLPQKFNVPILLGKAVNGDYVMSDLTKMPHCIIAGATGSGKSVCINTIVMSIVLNCKPDQVKLIMVDPKKVELTPYTRLPHMLSPSLVGERDGKSL